MRARKYIYIMMGTVALTLQGCRKDSHPSNPTPDTTQYAIGMAASSVAGTRALITETADLSEFAVYGYKQGPVNQMVFINQQVTKNGNGWTYSPTKYWDRTASYSFAAYAPSEQPGGFTYAHNEDTHTLTFTLPYWQKIDGTETDLIVATSQGAATTYLNTHGGQVDLAFDHLYAQLEVQVVRNNLLENEYYLNSLKYQDVPAEGGNATYTLQYTMPSASMPTSTTDAWMTIYSDGNAKVPPVENEEDKENEHTTFKYMVVPFTASSAEGFKIDVTYTSGGVQTHAVVNSGLQTLEPNKRYLLQLTINSGADIVTSPVEVLDWVDREVDEDDKYNW